MCRQSKFSQQRGYTLLGVLAITAVAGLISAGMLRWASGTLSTRKVVESNTQNFYAVERTINAVAAWLQDNSKNMVTAFNSTNFDNNFDLGDPSAGTNQGGSFQVPTLVKMNGTTHAVQLTNSSYFGTSAFPLSTNIDTGTSFDAAADFAATDFGDDVNVRLLLVWAMQTDGHYEPIFRIDAVTGGTGPEHGVHGVNFISSALVTSNGGVGYYAENGDFQTANPNNQCWSYQYTWNAGTSTWSRGAPRSNCLIGGQDDMQIKSAIHGSVSTNKLNGINLDHGSISGDQCEGPGCVSYTLPNYPTWDSVCAGVPAVDITVSSSPHQLTSGDALSEQCYRTITIPSNKTLNFATANKPYYIKNLLPQNNSNSRITFTTVGPGNKYTLYLDNLANGSINGNQLVGTNLAPHQLEINIVADGSLTINGNASMNAIIIGNSNHTINYSGNFTFHGALRSDAVNVTGNAVMGYDEALGGSPVLSDINYTLFKASQRYR